MCLRTSAFRIMAAKQKGNGNCCYENENEKRVAKNKKQEITKREGEREGEK